MLHLSFLIKKNCIKIQDVCWNFPFKTLPTAGALLKERCQAEGTKTNTIKLFLYFFEKVINLLYTKQIDT